MGIGDYSVGTFCISYCMYTCAVTIFGVSKSIASLEYSSDDFCDVSRSIAGPVSRSDLLSFNSDFLQLPRAEKHHLQVFLQRMVHNIGATVARAIASYTQLSPKTERLGTRLR